MVVVPLSAVNRERPDPDGTGRRTLGNERYGSFMETWTSRVLEYMDHDRDHDARGGRVGMCLWGRVEEGRGGPPILQFSTVQAEY